MGGDICCCLSDIYIYIDIYVQRYIYREREGVNKFSNFGSSLLPPAISGNQVVSGSCAA